MKRNSKIKPPAPKVLGVRIFGHTTDVDDADGEVQLWHLKQQKTFATVAERLYVSSTDAGDTLLINFDYIDENGLEGEGFVTTDGKNFVDTGIDVLFVNSATVVTPDGVAAGGIYLTRDNTDVGGDGIPDDITKIEAYIPVGHGVAHQAAYRIPLDYAGGAEYLGAVVRTGGTVGHAGIEVIFRYHPYGLAEMQFESWILGEAVPVDTLSTPFSVIALPGSIMWVTVITHGANNIEVTGTFYLTLLK